jgi:hypothetical protein
VREQQRGEEIAHLPVAQGVDFRVVGRAFDAVVPRQVVVAAVLIVFVVGFVVLVVVRHQIVEGEAVVGGDEIDLEYGRRPRWLNMSPEAVMRLAKSARLAFVAFPEGAHGVAELVVPFHPARREVADLIAAGATVPRFGDHFHLAQHRVLTAGHEEAVTLVETIVIAPRMVAKSKRKPSTCISLAQ